jgi:hypothetical protein
MPRMIKPFESHSAGQGTIADDGDHVKIIAHKVSGHGNAQRC